MDKNRLTKREELELYQEVKKIKAIGNQMLREIRAENKAMDIPIVFYKEGTVYYELPDGRTTPTPPPGFGRCTKKPSQMSI